MLRIKKNDIVTVIAGKEKGKRGKVLEVLTAENRIRIENINLVKKARRRTQQNQQGGIVDQEASLHISNVMLFCKPCNVPVRTKVSILKDGSKIRECKKCGAAL